MLVYITTGLPETQVAKSVVIGTTVTIMEGVGIPNSLTQDGGSRSGDIQPNKPHRQTTQIMALKLLHPRQVRID